MQLDPADSGDAKPVAVNVTIDHTVIAKFIEQMGERGKAESSAPKKPS
jgi:hypothetical protein